jgi:hypothetical protein
MLDMNPPRATRGVSCSTWPAEFIHFYARRAKLGAWERPPPPARGVSRDWRRSFAAYAATTLGVALLAALTQPLRHWLDPSHLVGIALLCEECAVFARVSWAFAAQTCSGSGAAELLLTETGRVLPVCHFIPFPEFSE